MDANILPKKFCWQSYVNLNPDLIANNITTKELAMQHYIMHGQYENREYFNRDIYLSEILDFLNSINNLKGVCLVTPDITGPVKNGGIGTACLHFAQSISKYSPVTILYTGCNIEDISLFYKYRQEYDNLNINFLFIPLINTKIDQFGANEDFFRLSYDIFVFLKRQNFTKIIFQDWLAHGFWSVRSKKLGTNFMDTTLSVMCQSCTKWQNEGMKVIPKDIWYSDKLSWAERETILNCDNVIATSEYMLNWLYENKYRDKNNDNYVIYQTYHKTKGLSTLNKNKNIDHIAFFGRLEKRKGLDIFLDSILSLDADSLSKIKKISFLGKHSTVDNISSKLLLDEFKTKTNIDIGIYDNFDHQEAIEYLLTNKCLAVTPSISDNAPLVVIESMVYQIPIIASSVGGIPEFLDNKNLFKPNPKSLAIKIKECLNNINTISNKKYSFKKNESKLKSYILSDTLKKTKHLRRSLTLDVCITTYNDARFLPALLEKFNQQTLLPDTIYIVNDGSTDEQSISMLEHIKNNVNNYRYSIEIIDKTNGGPSSARNEFIKRCKSDYIIFFDSDNIPYNYMIYNLYNSIIHDDYDVVYAGYDIVDHDGNITAQYIPLGNYLSVGSFRHNDLGDTCCIIKTKIAKENYFIEDNNIHEDWLMSLNLNIKQYKISSFNKSLFMYRKQSSSRSNYINNAIGDNPYYLIQYMNKYIKELDPTHKDLLLNKLLELIHLPVNK